MSSTRRQDVFTTNVNPLHKIYKPSKPEHEPPQYFPTKGRRQIYDFLQSKVNVHMKFGNSIHSITVCPIGHLTQDEDQKNLASTTQRTLRQVKPEHYP